MLNYEDKQRDLLLANSLAAVGKVRVRGGFRGSEGEVCFDHRSSALVEHCSHQGNTSVSLCF